MRPLALGITDPHAAQAIAAHCSQSIGDSTCS
jgi:hypothetical protein